MLSFTLNRQRTGPFGTFGKLFCSEIDFSCLTLELPWKNNERTYSCIPFGTYTCSPYCSSRFSIGFSVADVPDRSAILIHVGNHAGDSRHGFKTDSSGCILLGLKEAVINNQIGIANSQKAVLALLETTKKQSFELTIQGLVG